MKDMQEIIRGIDALEEICYTKVRKLDKEYSWERYRETLGTVKSFLGGSEPFGLGRWIPIEGKNSQPRVNVDVLVTVQESGPSKDTYRDIDCIIDNGDGPVWGIHHTATERVLAWVPMLPVYQPDESGKGEIYKNS